VSARTTLRAGVLALAALLLPPVAGALPAQAAGDRSNGSQSTIQPVIDANFADPDVLLVDGVYHAYATNSGGENIQHATSTDGVHWTMQPDALPVLGAWVGPCSFAPGGATDHCVWAPDVTAVQGGYVMYYTARDQATQKQCIGTATSTTPGGPFTPAATPLVCPAATGAIDASTYSENGQLYLLWKADGNCCNLPAVIYIQPLSADGLTLTGPPVELLRNDQPFEGAVVEAPTLVKHDGTYYLFFSANDFYGGNYRTGYATSSSLLGPYSAAKELMNTDMWRGQVVGPGGQDIVTAPDGTTQIFFHGWDPTFSYRALYVSQLTWSADGVPHVVGTATRYEAENGVVHDARVVADPAASAGAKVGGLDNPDSSVTINVYADHAGPAILGIRYDNGSVDANGNHVAATDAVTVNGGSAGTVTFANTAWGNWQLVEKEVLLQKGWNAVTFTKSTLYAEIDSVDLYYGHVDQTANGPAANCTSPTRYEAEAGVVTHARVLADASASGGAKVGGMDFNDSSITWQVTAAQAGPATLSIRFASGSERGGHTVLATDSLTVNGKDAGTVTFPNTTWENWQTVQQTVVLQKGVNTVTLTRDTFYAEIDALDVC
jgi:GH43 family beta-xylosidase